MVNECETKVKRTFFVYIPMFSAARKDASIRAGAGPVSLCF
jgi:hypothetical protein